MIESEETRLKPNFMNPSRVQDEIQTISDQLNDEYGLIGSTMEEKLTFIFQLTRTRAFIRSNTLISITKIPLTEKEQYDCLKLIPIAFKEAERFIKPVIKNEILWINKHENNIFMPVNRNCMYYGEMHYCEATKPVYRTSALNICEWQLYTNTTTKSCEYTEIIGNEEWVRINEETWLFSVFQMTNMSIICNNQKSKFSISNAGIIKFEPDCLITSNAVKIKTPKIVKTSAEAIKIQTHAVERPGLHTNAVIEKILTNKIENKFKRIWWHHLHHYTGIYFIFTTICIIVIYFYSKLELAPIP